ncbi:peptide/nickel transport system substrate-binding protein [Celerinatantimonas diazotrophica]|uniref:Peptide/nickel transport system substrate-binding protein n=2 Tax=Celerinatantimonas diazotrophica TaxID=412034 RepID=A0A4R1K264_9GAMM|nr:peptide/nickel transport system substrate-binding protein [Celerinatantimonas diazotrophica]CAG9298163.1 Heme-binding protein A [Celerinatantimonas diazotrophica]
MNCNLLIKGRQAMALVMIALGLLFSFSASAQVPKDILVVGQIAEPKSLDPQVDTAVNDFRILVNIYDGLVRFKSGSLQVEPALAKSWTINKAGTVYTFHLRKGIKFQDGTAFNAQAVKFDFERILDTKSPYHDTGPFPLAFFFSAVKQIKVIDNFTVQFVLDKPYAPFLANLAYPTGLIVSPAAVKKYGKDFGRHPVGTGPFEFKSWEPNSKVVLVRNPHYWDGEAKSKMVIFRPITDENTRVAEMMSGQLDIMPEVPPNSLSIFKSSHYKIYEQVGPHLWFLILNTRHGVFKDKRVRQAINYAINKKSLVNNVLDGTATVAAGPVPKAFKWAYNNKLKPYPYDPAKARKLIKEAGATGKTVTFYVTNGGSGMLDPVAMATAIQADLKAVGLNVKIQTYEWNTFLGKVNAGLKDNADMAEMAWMTNDPDTLPYLTLRTGAFPDKGGFNSGYYSNPEVDKLLAEARSSTNQATRAKLYKKMQVIVHNDAPWAFIASWKQNAVTSAAVQNFQLQPSFLLLLKNVYKK